MTNKNDNSNAVDEGEPDPKKEEYYHCRSCVSVLHLSPPAKTASYPLK